MNNILKFIKLYPNYPTVFMTALYNCMDSPEHPVYHPELFLDKHIDIVLSRCFEKNSKELHFTGMLHDILKHGMCKTLWGDDRKGRVREIPEGTYYQNVNHANHAVYFIEIPEVTAWIKSYGVNVDQVKLMVGNHMRMKSYLSGEKGLKNGMKKTKRDRMKNQLAEVWDQLYYFSTYCDNMRYQK